MNRIRQLRHSVRQDDTHAAPTLGSPDCPVPNRTLISLFSLTYRIKLALSLFADTFYDVRRFWRYSFTQGVRYRENLRARIAIGLHFLEYGMSLSTAQKGRGVGKARQLAADIETYVESFGHDATTEIALRTLEAYIALNAESEFAPSELLRVVELFSDLPQQGLRGGIESVTADAVQGSSRVDFLHFAESRHSIRDYLSSPVPTEAIERAVLVAQQSPSSCNRQTCRVRIWTKPHLVKSVLSLQTGNRGFGHQLGGLALITSDLCHWETSSERYQAWIDGGMFAMSFVYGLHAEGLGSVVLNWSVPRHQDRALRKLTGLPDNEQVVTMVGFGLIPKKLFVPVSQRKPIRMSLTVNSPLAERATE